MIRGLSEQEDGTFENVKLEGLNLNKTETHGIFKFQHIARDTKRSIK